MPLSLLASRQKNTYLTQKRSLQSQWKFYPQVRYSLTVALSMHLHSDLLSSSSASLSQISLTVIGASDGLMIPEGIRADLLRLCDEEEITPETFIETAIALLQSKPELKEAVVDNCWTQTSSLLCLQMRQPSWLVKKNDYKRLNDRQSKNSGRIA